MEAPKLLNIAAELESRLEAQLSRTAVCSVDNNELLDCETLLKSIREIAGALHNNGLIAGQRVALVGMNSPGFVKAYYGILYAGGVVVPLSSKLPPLLYARAIDDAKVDGLIIVDYDKIPNASNLLEAVLEARLRFIWCESSGELLDYPAIKSLSQQCRNALPAKTAALQPANAEAVILGTSGTTGPGKGVRLSHHNLLAGSKGFATRVMLSSSSNVLIAMPLSSSFGQIAMLTGALVSGGLVTLHEPFKPQRVVENLLRQDVTHFVGVPTMYSAMTPILSRVCGEDKSLTYNLQKRFYGIGGATVPPALVEQYSETYGISLRQGYGLTETASIASFTAPEAISNSYHAGPPIDDCTIEILGETGKPKPLGQTGEIVVCGKNVMIGYLGQPELQEQRFPTGDIGYKDASGNVVIVDRIKDLIIRGGENIYPRAVESCITQVQGVVAAAVVGEQDDYYGEVPIAFVVASNGVAKENEIRQFLASHMPLSNRPVRYFFVEELPMGPTGKVLKRELRSLLTHTRSGDQTAAS